ncbi:MAG: hypothetical protein ACYC8T_07270 [Myxococcaceae bacterium]
MKALFAAAVMGLAGVALAAEPAESPGLYQESQAYEIHGTVFKMKGDTVAIARPNLPPAHLKINAQTQITFDGHRVNADVLAAGTPVRAHFQLDRDEVVAVTIDATPVQQGAQPKKGKAPPAK